MAGSRNGTKIDSSNIRTKITGGIYKDDIGYYYRCGEAVIKCYLFKCKLCKRKAANCNQSATCSKCARIYNAGFRQYKPKNDAEFLFLRTDSTILADGKGEYRAQHKDYVYKIFKHHCNKCNINSMYTMPKIVAKRACHYCWYLKQGGTPHSTTSVSKKPKAGMIGSGDKIKWTKEERDSFNDLKDGLVASGREDLLKQNWTEERMDKWERELRDIWISALPHRHQKDEKNNPYKSKKLTVSSPKSEVTTPIQDSTPVKYVDDKEDRHQMFFNLFNDMISKGGMQRKLNGAILSLPSEYPWADKGRIDHFFHDPTEYLWYENQPGKLRSVRYVAKQLNKIMVNTIAYRVYDTDIMKSRHTNVGLANLDLECTMSPTIMEDAYEVIKAGLIGRKRIGFTLNTYGRGPKNMTLDKRDSLWNGLLNRFINDGHSIKYTSGRLGYTSGVGSTMFLFGAVIEQ